MVRSVCRGGVFSSKANSHSCCCCCKALGGTSCCSQRALGVLKFV
jgi:hypothetical protein